MKLEAVLGFWAAGNSGRGGVLAGEQTMWTSNVLSRFAVVGVLILSAAFSPCVASLVSGKSQPPRWEESEPARSPLASDTVMGGGAPTDYPGRLEGAVTEEGSGKPIEGVEIELWVSTLPKGQRNPRTATDANGRYHFKLPIGWAVISKVVAPSGYYCMLDSTGNGREARITRDRVAACHFKAKRGTVWPMEFRGAEWDAQDRAIVSARQVLADRGGAGSVIDARGKPGDFGLTLPSAADRFSIGGYVFSKTPCDFPRGPEEVVISYQDDFDPSELREVKRAGANENALAFSLVDRAGRTASVVGMEAINQAGKLRLVYPGRPLPPPHHFGSLRGKVLDDAARPLAGAKVYIVSCRYRSPDGNATMPLDLAPTTTDEKGEYFFPKVEIQRRPEVVKGITLLALKPGYAPSKLLEVKIGLLSAKEIFSAPPIELEDGITIRGRVLDQHGKPVEGALVRGEGYSNVAPYLFSDEASAATDEAGRFVLPDQQDPSLRPCRQEFHLSARFGRDRVTRTLQPFELRKDITITLRLTDW
jgi:protocatechuate 3,4-dioxygenase beta subunit